MNLQISHLRAQYLAGSLSPSSLIKQLSTLIHQDDAHCIWIQRLSLAEMLAYAQKLEGKDPASLPLYGIPFAIKDNIDLAGIPTTAGCPDFAYTPELSATVVQKLIEAGAIPVGKTNLDQFATGLVGVRSPYGACKNSINPNYISGGSSSGSSVAVALNMASFSLGTDTAGSGRVPAAFNNLVGLKPSCGLLSTQGVVPACRTLDCVSIFAKSAADAAVVLNVAQGFDQSDAYSRQQPSHRVESFKPNFKFGIPKTNQLNFFGNTEAPSLFKGAIARLEALGGQMVELDFDVFLKTARLLYEGPWVAERYTAIKDFIETKPQAFYPVTYEIINGAKRFTATDTFAAQYQLKALQRQSLDTWQEVDLILTPTAGTIYTIDEVKANPIKTNSNLGYYTNFMNLLDLAAVAIPAGFQSNGLPFGITVCAPAFSDEALIDLAQQLEEA